MKHLVIALILAAATVSHAQIGIRHARGQQCNSNLKQIGLGLTMFMDDNGNRPPKKLEDARSYIPANINICPNSRKNYIYLGHIPGNNRSSLPIVIDRIGNHPGQINVLMQDGHVVTIRHNARNYQGLLNYFKGLSPVQKKQLSQILKKLDSGRR